MNLYDLKTTLNESILCFDFMMVFQIAFFLFFGNTRIAVMLSCPSSSSESQATTSSKILSMILEGVFDFVLLTKSKYQLISFPSQTPSQPSIMNYMLWFGMVCMRGLGMTICSDLVLFFLLLNLKSPSDLDILSRPLTLLFFTFPPAVSILLF